MNEVVESTQPTQELTDAINMNGEAVNDDEKSM
jgi:hypothetical protein